MFDIGFSELLVIGIIALVVIGPEQLPSTIRMVTYWVNKVRRSFQDAKAEIQREIGADEIRAQLHNDAIMRSLQESKQEFEHSVDDLERSVEGIRQNLSDDGLIESIENSHPDVQQSDKSKHG